MSDIPTSKACIVTTLKPGVNLLVENLAGGQGKGADIPLSAIISTLVEEALEHRGLFKRPEKGPNSARGGLSLRLTELAQQKGIDVQTMMVNGREEEGLTTPDQITAKQAANLFPKITEEQETTMIKESGRPLYRVHPCAVTSQAVQEEAERRQTSSVASDLDPQDLAMMSEVMAETMSKFIEKRQAAKASEAARVRELVV